VLDTVNGLPVHPLIVHAVVVLAPLSVLLLLAALASRVVRERAGIATPLLATASLALIPLATESGEALERRVGRGDLVRTHAEMGESLLPWMLGVTAIAWAVWWFSRPVRRAAETGGRPIGRLFIPLVVLGLIASVGTAVTVVRIGDSGAKAVWHDSGQQTPAAERGGDDD
jgi:uncharacterized membrane protein